MMSPSLPSVLQGTNGNSSISMERALNQIKDLLVEHVPHGDPELEDRVLASCDDVEVMLQAIQRGD